ncbi:MAG: prolipoprotein diacylglyceryl transferase [Chthoniobacterales bacterium]|nr:prolipoprotein diacylglyceryl transferase [Chthoniobacterales bacterium]
MRPVLFDIPFTDIPIYGYGLMMVLGFLASVQLVQFLARRSGLDPEVFVNGGLIALISGVLGARVSHILENFSNFSDPNLGLWGNLKEMANLRSGGLTFFGGLLLAFPVTLFYGWRKRVPLRLGMDIMAPAIMLSLVFGRIGCFLNGCCYGAECHVPWAVHYPYYSNAYIDHYADGKIQPPDELLKRLSNGKTTIVPADKAARDPVLKALAAQEHSLDVHPAQLYSMFNALLLAAVLTAFFTMPHAPGRVFALMFVLKGITRFLLEMLRVEPSVLGHGSGHFEFLPAMSYSMVVSIGLFVGGIVMWYAFGRYERSPGHRDEMPLVPSPSARGPG